MGDWDSDDPVLVRAHSSAENDDFLGSIFGDYNEQIKKSLAVIGKEGKGLLVLMRHEEKGRTLLNQLEDLKRKADAKEEIKPDRRSEMEQRDCGVGAQILNDLGVRKIRLITNTPRRRIGLIGYGLEIVENVQL